MFDNSLDLKPNFKRPDGIELKDLTCSMFNLQSKSYVTYSLYKVPAEFAMRPDLISAAVYNSTAYAEIILKFNGISNPFTIKEGDIILIPNLDSVRDIISPRPGSIADTGKKLRDSYKYIDPTKVPKSDNKFQSRELINIPDEALPPNITKEGEQQIVYRNGRVYFGQGVETCLQNGMTQSEFLTTIIKSKNKKNK